jgi:cellobiose phosphorylase
VQNPSSISKGVQTITVDGINLEENVAPVFNDGRIHNVVAVIGR